MREQRDEFTMKSDSPSPQRPDPPISVSTSGTEGQGDEWTDSETDGCGSIRPLLTQIQIQESPTRQIIKQEKREKKKRKNKKIRKRIRRIVRTSWKWVRRGFAGLSPIANGMAMAFGPVVRQNSAHTTSVYGARP